jgi:hypothetical protein
MPSLHKVHKTNSKWNTYLISETSWEANSHSTSQEILAFYRTRSSLHCSQQSATGPFPESDESSPHTALGPTQPPIQWVPGPLFLGVKRSGREADHSPPSSAEVKEWVKLYLHSPNTPQCRGAQLKHRDNFTFTTSSHPISLTTIVIFSYLCKYFPDQNILHISHMRATWPALLVLLEWST